MLHAPHRLLLVAAFLTIPLTLAAQDFEKAVVKTIPVSGNVVMLDGAGGYEAFSNQTGAIIRFKHAKVIHAGDTFFNGFYPFIDVSSGGSLDGMIANAKHLLTLADANTKIIPGHGPLGDRAALQAYHDVLVGVRKNVTAAMQGGKALSEMVKAAPTKPWDATWGTGFLNPETFTTLVYEDLKRTVK